ncbi:MAG: outer membrane beta-barrel protein, partial [Acidobacteriota bacterium]
MRLASTACATLLLASSAAAQAVGSGSLTGTLASDEPQSGVLRLGPLRIAPGLVITELGVDDNIFNETNNPKSDFVIAGTPDVALFTRLPLMQLSAYAGAQMQYFNKYESERDIGYSFKGRVDFLLSRLSPFIGAAETRSRRRPNGEIDVRTDIQNNELGGGVAYDLSAHAKLFGAAVVTEVDYRDAFQSDVSLDQSLSHTTTDYMGGVTTAITPLLGLQVRGNFKQDEFPSDPTRNGESRSVTAVFTFDAAAFIAGSASVAYQDYRPVDPLVARYEGLTANIALTYPFFELGRFNFSYNRGMDYSFDVNEAYYVTNGLSLGYTQRLVGEVDLQAIGSRSLFDYGNRVGSVARTDTLDLVNGNLGYNLRNRTRIAAN